jgi:hypothetical protein
MEARSASWNHRRVAAWLAAAVFVILLPPFVSRNFEIGDLPAINAFILLHPIKHYFSPLFPWFNLVSLVLVIGVLFGVRAFSRIFPFHMVLTYALAAVLQNISFSDRYGFSICSSSFLISLGVAFAWLAETKASGNTFARVPGAVRRWAFLPLILLAIWFPIHPVTHLPDPDIAYFLSSGSMLTFCMTTVVVLSILLVFYPDVNFRLLRATGVFGLLIGLGNLFLEFVYLPGYFWVGVLHIPLVLLSAAGVGLSFAVPGKGRNPE